MRKLSLSMGLGVIVMASTTFGSTLTALQSGDVNELIASIAIGNPLDERNEKGQTALLVTTWGNNIEAARLLIEAGADVNAKDSIQDSPFLVAGAEGRVEILKLVLSHGADVKSINRYGGTALIPAAEKGHLEAVSLLINAGVDVNHVNNLGWTALMEAVVLSDGGAIHQDIIKLLLAGGADRNIPDANGVKAIEHAKARGFSEVVKLLNE